MECADGMNVLTRCCCHGSAEVRLSLLSLMRDLVRAGLTQLTSGIFQDSSIAVTRCAYPCNKKSQETNLRARIGCFDPQAAGMQSATSGHN